MHFRQRTAHSDSGRACSRVTRSNGAAGSKELEGSFRSALLSSHFGYEVAKTAQRATKLAAGHEEILSCNWLLPSREWVSILPPWPLHRGGAVFGAVMISIVLYGRNDNYGYNLHKRAALSLNCMAEVLTDLSDEIIFVDYNTPDDLPTFQRRYKTLSRAGPVKC